MSLYPWTSCQEWNDVYEWLYSSDTEHQRKGVARVAAWKVRGVVPALLEVTADMVCCQVHEQECFNSLDFSGQVLRLIYAMALTRFVNGAFDVHFVTNPGLRKDIKSVLCQFGIPAYIVTLRHQCAHRTLPSLGALKCAVSTGLQWLRDIYWEPQRQRNRQREESNFSEGVGDAVCFSGAQRSKKPLKKVKLLLSDCSAVELSEQLLQGYILRIADFKVIAPQVSNLQALPELRVDIQEHAQWWQAVGKVEQTRPGLQTLVVCAIITAMHSPLYNFVVVFWPEENAVTPIQITNVIDPPRHEVKTGVPCTVKDRKGLHNGTIAAIDKQQTKKRKRRTKDGKENAGKPKKQKTGRGSMKRRNFLAAWLGKSLTVKSGKGLNAESVDWLEVFSTAQHNPGYYSGALMNIVVPQVSQQLHQDVIKQTKEFTEMVTLSERFSQYAYTRPLSATTRQELEKEVSIVFKARLGSRGVDPDCKVLEEAPPPSKRARLSTATLTSKWSVVSNSEEWVGCEVGLCPGQVASSTFLDLNCTRSGSELSAAPPAKSSAAVVDRGSQSQHTFSKREVARIQTTVQKHLLMNVCLPP